MKGALSRPVDSDLIADEVPARFLQAHKDDAVGAVPAVSRPARPVTREKSWRDGYDGEPV
jgi:hypothetical protein